MSKANPPVFPITHNGSTLPGSAGLTMRDYFAGLAMQSFIIRRGGKEALETNEVVEESYILADAMLAERVKQ